MTHSRKRLTFVALVALVGSVAAGAEAELVAKYFAALRVRGLFVVAEEYASARLAGADLAAAERTLLTIELARTLLEHGGSAIGAQREELWADAQKSLQDLLATSRDDAARLPAQAWLALIPAAQAQTLAWEALLTPEDESLRGAAIVRLRRSIVEIKSLLPRLDGAAKGSSVRGVGAGDLTAAAQLPAAQRELAEVLIDLADLEPGSHERTANLLDAAAQLERIVRPAADAALGTHIRVLQARAARLQGDERRAASLLDGIAGSDVGFPEKDEALAERLRLDLERGKPDAAFELVARRLRQSEPPTAELRAAIVDVLLACWQLATTRGDGKLAAQLLAEARSQHEQTSGRWRTWTAAKLDRQQTDAELGIPLASLVRQARGAWQSKRLSEAAGK